ncbi:MAG: hypothetical protein QXQ48_05840 [Nitrososphaerota archaeon]
MPQVDIEKYVDFLKRKLVNIPFSKVIEATTGHKVQPLSAEDKAVVNEIYNSAKEVLKWARSQDFGGMRPNEISNKLESQLRQKLGGKIPKGKKAGYPNIEISRGEANYYIEVKLADETELNSSFRSFYYEPVELAKVKRDSRHILVGYIHRNKKVKGFKIVDLSKINVSLKNEFNTSNIELYKREAVIKEYQDSSLNLV